MILWLVYLFHPRCVGGSDTIARSWGFVSLDGYGLSTRWHIRQQGTETLCYCQMRNRGIAQFLIWQFG